ncbi:hypothetical protein SCHPADRAFT_925157 [Schizopora paradoxa]|uniref:BRCT domain-containing protein n=1 Tax=Schizopora paradoxa TaxID=27342 RepID=A0A0H2S328_9AGAM|nr:hypothetical protein SCHPADRAFT_925157 [Schizopora paradoxa]
MAPQSRSSARQQDASNNGGDASSSSGNDEIFIDPMLGSALAIYVDKDVDDRDIVIDLIVKYGGTVSPGYSGVPHLLVDPHKETGQSLYRQYAGKKGKIILDSKWVHECVQARELLVFNKNWGGCKVTGKEVVNPLPPPPQQAASQQHNIPQANHPQQPPPTIQAPPGFGAVSSHALPPNGTPVVPDGPGLGPPPPNFPYVYDSRTGMPPHTPTSADPNGPPPWHAPGGMPHPHMPPPHPQMMHRPPNPYGRDDQWPNQHPPFHQMGSEPPPMGSLHEGTPANYYDQRFREDHPWPSHPGYYPPPPFDPNYPPPPHFMAIPGPVLGPPSAPEQPVASTSAAAAPVEKPRGRKRARANAPPAPPVETLVANKKRPPARSPTPPARVIKSTYGGNLFTVDDIMYLKKYIDYCQDQGLVLSLREICERIAVKAPHHTFYSWRRYCNKHQIRLGGYAMEVEGRSGSPGAQGVDEEEPADEASIPVLLTVDAAQRIMQDQGRNRSPTPPRALFRSTTGKGVAFTEEDVSFLCKFLAYRKMQGRLDMITFWKDVATKAPHHSRASWMKYYRRHKHEINRIDGDEPLPAPPVKKMRYSRGDDILLAQFFANKPEGTSDKIFQEFAKIYPHHPWKGWQEHHRIHKTKIDHFIGKIHAGEVIEPGDDDE